VERTGNEVGLASMFLVQALFTLGEWKEAVWRQTAFVTDARARGDLFQEMGLSTLAHLPALMADRPDEARDAVDRVRALVPRADASRHYGSLVAHAVTALYRDAGAGEGALSWVMEAWPAVARSGILLTSRIARTDLLYLRGRARLAAAASAASHRRPALVRAAERDARTLGRIRSKAASAYDACLRAGIAACRGDEERACAFLDAARAAAEAADMAIFAAAARRRLGERLAGDEGAALIASADAAMRAQEIRSPARLTAMFFPGAW
jgi:hypothetical protein